MIAVRKAIFDGGERESLVSFIREERVSMSYLRRVVVEPARTRIIDVNRNELVLPGISYGHPWLELVLKEAGASFDPQTLHLPPPTSDGTREFGCSSAYPWAHDRVL